jgi:guanine deaminase
MDSRTDDNETPLDILFASARIVHRRNFLTTGAAALMAAAGSDAALAKETPKQAASDQDRKFMSHAVDLMRKAGVVEKTGGPFGAVVVMNNEILSSSGNSVLRDNDPSAHAEVNAIRMACKKVGSPHIKGRDAVLEL